MDNRIHTKPVATKAYTVVAVLFSICFMLALSCTASVPATGTPSPASTSPEVEISGFAYVPETITISAGTTVTWTNQDSVAHTVTSRDNLFDSGTLSQGADFSYTFTQSGTFDYYCTLHPNMKGKVIVE